MKKYVCVGVCVGVGVGVDVWASPIKRPEPSKLDQSMDDKLSNMVISSTGTASGWGDPTLLTLDWVGSRRVSPQAGLR